MADTLVKICGLQSVEVLKSIKKLPVDYIGLVFARSRRQVTLAQASEMLEVLGHWDGLTPPLSVGVFVNPKLDDLNQILRTLPLDVVQLHGSESAEFCREVRQRYGVRVIKALPVGSGSFEEKSARLETYSGAIDALMLDTYDPLYGGGSGIPFDWSRIGSNQQWASERNIPLFVAGGLTPNNVEHLITEFHPQGVDVSSGVETDGVKDIEKIRAFVERVKGQ